MGFLDDVGNAVGSGLSAAGSYLGVGGAPQQPAPMPMTGAAPRQVAGQDPMMNLYNMAKRREQRQDQDMGGNALQAQLFRNPAPPAPMPDQIPPRPQAPRPQGGMQGRMQQEGLIGG